MDQSTLQDRISRGLGIAARSLGALHDAYRPRGAGNPLAVGNRYLRLQAAFNAGDTDWRKPNGYGDATWTGVFDSAYTQPGDYLAGPSGIFFIAAQQPLLPVLCVQANRTIVALRPAAPTAAGANAYGGLQRSGAATLLNGWPASLLAAGRSSSSATLLPADGGTPTWSVLLPPTPATLRSSDILVDDLGRSFVIASAEITDLGWRLQVRQSAT